MISYKLAFLIIAILEILQMIAARRERRNKRLEGYLDGTLDSFISYKTQKVTFDLSDIANHNANRCYKILSQLTLEKNLILEADLINQVFIVRKKV